MAFTKIENTELNSRGATKLPDRPSEVMSAHAIKVEVDYPTKQIVAPAFNNLIDELEDTTAAASIGAVAPSGATGNTIQTILNGVYGAISTAVVDVAEIKSEISTVAVRVTELEEEAHTHSNKALLDTYTQTESDLADAVSNKHSHENKALLDTYDQTNSDISSAIELKHVHPNRTLLDTYEQTEANLADAVSKKHEHSNKAVLDKFGESSGQPTYNGEPIGGGAGTWGSITGTLSDQTDLKNALDAKASISSIPTQLSELTDDSTHRVVTDSEKTAWNAKNTVSVTQIKTSGVKIATVTVDSTSTDIYAPQGGSGGGSVNNAYKNVKVGSTTISASGEDTLELVAGSNVTLTPDATNKKVTVSASGGGASTGDMLASDYDSNYDVKTAGGIDPYVSSQISTAMSSLATVATSGSYNDLSNQPTIPDVSTKYDTSDTAETALDDADYVPFYDTSASARRKTLWSNIKTVLANLFMKNDGSNAASEVALPSTASLTVGSRVIYSTVGDASFSQGVSNIASGEYSHAEGNQTVSSASCSHAEGYGTNTDYGYASHAEGYHTTSSGHHSHAEGRGTTSSGEYSHAEGYNTVSGYEAQHVSGSYNNNKSTTLFEIGNGTDNSHRSNAFEVYSDGKFSQDDGTTKYKFTSLNGENGFYDASGTFHTFGASGPTINVTPILTSGVKIATVEVDGNDTDLYAPQGGGGGTSTKRYIYGSTISTGATGIGTWYSGDLSNITSNDESDWWQDDDFKGLLSDDNFDIKILFDPLAADEEVLVCSGYILDDTTGKLCIKFNGEVAKSTHRVAVDITSTDVQS